MSNYKYGDWYCRPANEEEAQEIIERAVASGALLKESLRQYSWGLCSAWGVLNGFTHTSDPENNGDELNKATEYTITQIRELFPLPGEKGNAGWNDEWLPPVGTVCESVYTSPDEYYRVKILAHDDGEVVFRWVDGPNESDVSVSRQYQFGGNGMKVHMCFRPLRTERERWIEDTLPILHENSNGHISYKKLAEVIYDALKSGTLRAPEVE